MSMLPICDIGDLRLLIGMMVIAATCEWNTEIDDTIGTKYLAAVSIGGLDIVFLCLYTDMLDCAK